MSGSFWAKVATVYSMQREKLSHNIHCIEQVERTITESFLRKQQAWKASFLHALHWSLYSNHKQVAFSFWGKDHNLERFFKNMFPGAHIPHNDKAFENIM